MEGQDGQASKQAAVEHSCMTRPLQGAPEIQNRSTCVWWQGRGVGNAGRDDSSYSKVSTLGNVWVVESILGKSHSSQRPERLGSKVPFSEQPEMSTLALHTNLRRPSRKVIRSLLCSFTLLSPTPLNASLLGAFALAFPLPEMHYACLFTGPGQK